MTPAEFMACQIGYNNGIKGKYKMLAQHSIFNRITRFTKKRNLKVSDLVKFDEDEPKKKDIATIKKEIAEARKMWKEYDKSGKRKKAKKVI